jgi:MoxR-like ATPase
VNETRQDVLDAGTYEIIRNRLQEQRLELSGRLAQLNKARKEIFNSSGFQLIANQRISTGNNGVARGITAIGNTTIFAYNVHFGLKEDIKLSDVFSIYQFTGDHFDPQPLSILEDPSFITDYTNLYKYYRDSIFAGFHRKENFLYMVFQTSKNPDDRKAFKWLIRNEQLLYQDDRSIHEVRQAAQHDFQWIQSDLSNRRLGIHPHISILDKVFIEALNGDITFKIENNTDTGKGIFSDPVQNRDQQLDDALYYYADLGNLIAIKIKPYQEAFRAYIFNVRTKEVVSIPSLVEAGIVLPEQQGIIFSTGYYLQSGEYKLFENGITDLEFIQSTASPNGEDFLYCFYQRSANIYVLMSYNVIARQVETPIICNGYTIFNDGKLVYFRSENEAIRHHQVQIWETPYTSSLRENLALANNYLYKIGNKDIVAAMSECQEVLQLIQKEDSYEGLYEDILKKSSDILDTYFWIKDASAEKLAEPLGQIQQIANTAIDEFAKVQAQRKHAQELLQTMRKKVDQQVIDIKNASIQSLDQLVSLLATTRGMLGAVIDLLNVKYIDTAGIQQLRDLLQSYNQSLSEETIRFLLKEEALLPYEHKVTEQKQAVERIQKVIDAQPVTAAIQEIAHQLEMVIDILNSLKIEDSTQTTRIIERIAVIFSSLNEVKAALTRTISNLRTRELTGEFHAQLTLLEQSMVNFLDLSDSPEKADEYLTKISIQVEELESKFADFEEFVLKIADKREEITKAFSGKKEILLAQINKRTGSLEQIGLRVLKNIENKVQSLDKKESIYAFFASDLMIDKIRSLAEELKSLGDVAKAENLLNLIKLTQENALRQLRDKTELFDGGNNLLSLGKHQFIVNKQVLDLNIVRRNERLYFHLLGTSFYKEVKDENLYAYQSIWDQEIISENQEVYRAEFLAYDAFLASNQGIADWDASTYINGKTERDFAAGYIKGVHNTDALAIFQGLKKLEEELGILKFSPKIRAQAQLCWLELEESVQNRLRQLISATYAIEKTFPQSRQTEFVVQEIIKAIQPSETVPLTEPLREIAVYLYEEFSVNKVFTISQQAFQLTKSFKEYLQQNKQLEIFHQDTDHPSFTNRERFRLIRGWINAYLRAAPITNNDWYLNEAVSQLVFHQHPFKQKTGADSVVLDTLKGTHGVIKEGRYLLHFHSFMEKLQRYNETIAPAFTAFNELKAQLIKNYRNQLKIAELEPKVLSSFIRNRLINEVYFPLIGANLAKQIGSAGDDKRTARMGMLLLVSPPGYGKTTLMEYLAKTMGLHFVKINGPTIGHKISSIDPLEATTSGAREELKKINLAFEMADNVMLYIDDIQHCSAEFLQKFISLADGQRKMDGIFEGESKTYDLRGKRFCVVMAGNPYTESGEQFKIPDMLANRADVYNLGDVIGNSDALFQLSLIENSVAENSYLQKITNKSFTDLYKLIQYLEDGAETIPELEGNHSQQDLEDAMKVLKHMLRIRDIVIQVNQQYIASAAMKDAYRTEPAFKLQGSYRNMNKLAGRVVPLMNEEEIRDLIRAHYEGESQTLTSDAEANLLKLKELGNMLSPAEETRWKEIQSIFRKNNRFGGMAGQDSTGLFLQQMNAFNEQLEAIAQALQKRN